MNAVERALRDFLLARPRDVAVAVVGGMAVSARTAPRPTRDLDVAVAVADAHEAARYVSRLRQLGYEILTPLQQTAQQPHAIIRIRHPAGPLHVDLLFAVAGIAPEVVQAATPVEIAAGLVADVAQVGHLIALKLFSRDDARRPQDRDDLAPWPGWQTRTSGTAPRKPFGSSRRVGSPATATSWRRSVTVDGARPSVAREYWTTLFPSVSPHRSHDLFGRR